MLEKTAFKGWNNCLCLSNGSVELIATTDVGPRIVHLGFAGGPNLFKEFPKDQGLTGGDTWRAYGGHRLWHAPEAMPRTYQPDNGLVPWQAVQNGLLLRPGTEKDTGIRKEIEVTIVPDRDVFTVRHRLFNAGLWPVELAPWALSVMAPGGRAVLFNEPYAPHPEALLPVRPLVLWAYTNMADPRWSWGRRTMALRQDPQRAEPQKAGVRSTSGWAAYELDGHVFLKKAPFDPGARYPDFECNIEVFTNAEILEIESLGPLTRLAPGGGCVEHVERWFLFRATLGESDDERADALEDLVAKAEQAE